LIKEYKIKYDKVAVIGEGTNKIPYFGEYAPEMGIIFDAKMLPEVLLLILNEFMQEGTPQEDYVGDLETMMIILANISPDEKEQVTVAPKFQPKGRKRGMKIENATDHSGYKVMLAYMGDVGFHSDDPKPSSGQYCCFWEGQNFDNKPVCIPLRYEFKNGKHEFYGPKRFCNIFCLYAYLIDQSEKIHNLRPSWLEKAMQLTMIAFKLMFPNETTFKPADPKDVLDIYGGNLAIEKYRTRNYNGQYYESNNIFFNEVQTADYIF
jgi:hypothetical protein